MDETVAPASPRVTSRFIPLTRQAVIADLCNDPARKAEHGAFSTVALRLQRHRGRRYRILAREMRRAYLPFSPDRDTVRVLKYSDEERDEMEARLSQMASYLLDRANYAAINTDELNEILNKQTAYSLRISVDLAEYDELQIYKREVYTERHSIRRPEMLYLVKAHDDVRIFRRLFVLLKLKPLAARAAEIAKEQNISLEKAEKKVRRRRKGLPKKVSSDFIYMKVFKDMPEHDLQILFPLRAVQFRPFDKLKFFATAGGGTLFGAFTMTGKILAATNPFALLGALAGFIGLLARQITTFFNQRNRYMMELAQKLFFHNLANNRAALTLLLDRAEEEDVKEDLIALYFNAGERVPLAELSTRKRAIDAMIAERYGTAVDFEINDAISRLKEDGVVSQTEDALVFQSLTEAAITYANHLDASDADDARRVCEPAPPTDLLEA